MLAINDRVVVIGVFGIPVQTGTIIDTMEASEDNPNEISCAAYKVRFDRPLSGDTIVGGHLVNSDWWVEDTEVLESEFTAASSSPQ